MGGGGGELGVSTTLVPVPCGFLEPELEGGGGDEAFPTRT